MKKNEKIATGIAVGAAVVALFLIPKTRKLLSKGLCSATDSIKGLLNKTEHLAKA